MKRFFLRLLLLLVILFGVTAFYQMDDMHWPGGKAVQELGEKVHLDQVMELVDSVFHRTPEAPPLDPDLYPYYASLDENGKLVYYELLKGLEIGADTVSLRFDVTQKDLEKIVLYINFDQPQLFWFEGDISYTYDKSTDHVVEVRPSYNKLVDDLEVNKAKVEKAVAPVLEKIADMKKPAAEKYCHDYLARKVSYQEGKYDQNIYSALVQKKTVCAGYTRAMQYLMLQRGIPCYYCIGTSYSTSSKKWEDHSWNIIKLKGGYYNLDLTWDDFRGEKDKYPSAVFYTYYNVTDKVLLKDHKRDQYSELLPACKSTKRSYKSYYGHSWLEDLGKQIDLDRKKPVKSLESFYKLCRKRFEKNGTGDYTLAFTVKGRKTMKSMEALDSSSLEEHIFRPVGETLGLNGYRYQYQLKYWELGNKSGCYYVEVHLSVS